LNAVSALLFFRGIISVIQNVFPNDDLNELHDGSKDFTIHCYFSRLPAILSLPENCFRFKGHFLTEHTFAMTEDLSTTWTLLDCHLPEQGLLDLEDSQISGRYMRK
jgi:hypothetical protein